MVTDPSFESGDRELLDAMRRGDTSAFGAFYSRHRAWIMSLAYRFTENREDALDVLQETFVYLLRKLPSLELRVATRTFLYPVVKHLALDRKQARRRHAPLEPGVDPMAQREAQPDDFSESEVGQLLHRLPDGEKEVVWLRFVDGLDLQSIADLLAIPLGTVKSRLHAALGHLRDRMA